MSGLAWLHPGWLWGLAALAVPLAVHFLSRGPARSVPVPSVRLLAASASRRARRVRFTDPWLALLRAALLAAVTLALAGPHVAGGAREPVWGLVDPALLADASWRARAPDVAARLDRLADDGALRLLVTGLPTAGEGVDSGPAAGGVWSLLREADTVAPAGTTFVVLTHGTAAELVGTRPRLGSRVIWDAVPPPSISWTERTVRLADAVHRWTARSNAAITRVERAPAEASVAAAGLLPERPLRVVLAADPERAADAEALAAAIDALVATDWLSIELSRLDADTAAATPPAADVALWLAAAPVPDAWRAWVRRSGWLLRDAPGERFQACDTVADLPGGLGSVAIRGCAPVDPGTDAAPLWTDRRGEPLLTAAEGGRVLTLASRLHPAWSDLGAAHVLPRWLAGLLDRVARAQGLVGGENRLLDGEGGTAATRDHRQAGASDRRPRVEEAPAAAPRTAAAMPAGRPLEPWLWAAAAALLAAERVLAARRTG